jgi:DnaJ-domain-containing protein 1
VAEQASMRAILLLPQGEVRARLYLSDTAQPPPWEQLELRFRLMLWSEMAEDTFGSLAVLEEDLRRSKAAYLAPVPAT